MIPTTIAIPSLFRHAYEWVCRARKRHPADADVWELRFNWGLMVQPLIEDFSKGNHRFEVQKKVTLATGDTVALWSARDALVIKVLTWIIQEAIQPLLSRACYHVKGHGGLKGAVQDVLSSYPRYRFFCKTDVKHTTTR